MNKWQITIKGFWPEEKQKSGQEVTGLTYGYRTLEFTGTNQEFDQYIKEITSVESVKIISIHNMAETMVEFEKQFNLENKFTGKIIITDCFEHKKWLIDEDIAMLMFSEKEKFEISIYLAHNPCKRFYFDKKALKNFIELYKCQPL